MKRTRLFCSSVALLVLVGCAVPVTSKECGRLGGLCSDREEVVGLGLAGASNASADLDGDGVPDLVTAAPEGSLSIVWGGGTQREYRVVPGGVADVELADVDGDGDLDVVFATIEPASLRVLNNVGGRALPEGNSVALVGPARSLWVGGLDGDDSPDAVVASLEGLTVVTQGLTHSRQFPVGRALTKVQAGDLNGDGLGDIVVADEGAFFVVLARGSGFATPRRVASGPDLLKYLELVDLDGDGSLDVLTHGAGIPEIWLHTGDGAGGFAEPRGLLVQDRPSEGFGAHRDEQGGRWLYTVDQRRLMGHRLDDADRIDRRVVTSSFAGAHGLEMDAGALMIHGSGEGRRYSLGPAYVFSEVWNGIGGGPIDPLAIGDLDLDGEPELVTVDEARQIVTRKRLPEGQWTELPRMNVPSSVYSMAVADVTGDGLPDVVLGEGDGVRVAIGLGDGRFTLGPANPLGLTPWVMYQWRDTPGGDVLVGVVGDSSPLVLRFDAAGVVLEQTQPITVGLGRPALAFADIDGDGRTDLVAFVQDQLGVSLVLVPRTADGWGEAQVRPLSALLPEVKFQEFSLVVGDIDGDDDADAVITTNGTVVRLQDIGAAMPPPPEVVPVHGADGGEVLALSDVDGDGEPDLVYCGSVELGVVLAVGGPAPRPQAPLGQWNRTCALHTDPVGDRTIAATVTDRGTSVLTAALVPALKGEAWFVGGPSPLHRLATGDIDADGRTDAVVSDDGARDAGSFAVVRAGRPGPVLWKRGDYEARAELVLAPIDDRPGDEIVTAWSSGRIRVWSLVDGSLVQTDFIGSELNQLAAVAVQRRGPGRSDVVVAGTDGAAFGRIDALSRGDDGKLIYDGATTLWNGAALFTAPAIAIADLDGDHYDDLVVHPERGQPVQVLWGNRERIPITTSVAFAPDSIYRIASADADGDGAAEVVLGTSTGLWSVGFAGRRQGEPVLLDGGAYEDEFVIADMEGDGVPDILRRDYTGLDVLLRASGEQVRAALSFYFTPWSDVQAVHLDDDGIRDLVGLRDGKLVMRRSSSD